MEKKSLLLPYLLLPILGMALFWPGLGGGFVFDDYSNLVEDSDWKVESLELSQWWRAAKAGIASDSGRPLAMLSFALNHYLAGPHPLGMKLTSLLMHVLNGLLVFALCCRLFEVMHARDVGERLGRFAALMVAMAWMVHPIQVSTALYIVQRMEVGACTGVLLALLFYMTARRRQMDGRRSWPWWLLSFLGWLLGLGFKESALLAPVYALVLEVFGLHFRSNQYPAEKILKGSYALLVAGGALIFFKYVLPWAMRPETYAFREFSLSERLFTQAHVLLLYLDQILLPFPERLAFYYDNFPVSTGVLAPPATLAGFLVLVLSFVGAGLVRKRWPLVSLGVAWFWCAHFLTSNVVPLELAFEHRNYFALLGVAIAVAQLLAWPAHALLSQGVARLIGVLMIAVIALCGTIQASTWGEPFRLAYALASRNPDSLRAGYQLGVAMLEHAGGDPESPLVDLALGQFEHAGRRGASPLPEQGIIIASSRTGRPVPIEVWDRFRTKLRNSKAGVEQINALRGVLECRIRGFCVLDDQQLLETLLVAMQSNPGSALVHVQYANFAWNVAGERELAISLMREAVRLEPGNPQYMINLVNFLRASGGDRQEIRGIEQKVTEIDRTGAYGDQIER